MQLTRPDEHRVFRFGSDASKNSDAHQGSKLGAEAQLATGALFLVSEVLGFAGVAALESGFGLSAAGLSEELSDLAEVSEGSDLLGSPEDFASRLSLR